MPDITKTRAKLWVEGYVRAWHSNKPEDIAAIFAEDADAHERPYATDCDGLREIIELWHERATWDGTDKWTFEWEIVAINGDTFVVTGTGCYAALGDFNNLWVVTLDAAGRASSFRMWNNQI